MDVGALHKAYLDTATSKDFDGMRALFHPEYHYVGADGTEGGIDVGIEVARMYTSAFPDLHFDVNHASSCGETSVIEFTARGTNTGELMGMPATGKAVSLEVCNVIEARDGLIYREREYYNEMSMAKQLGMVPDEA